MFRLRIVATAIACSLLVRSVLAGGPSSGVLALSQDDKAALAQAAKNVREIIGHRPGSSDWVPGSRWRQEEGPHGGDN